MHQSGTQCSHTSPPQKPMMSCSCSVCVCVGRCCSSKPSLSTDDVTSSQSTVRTLLHVQEACVCVCVCRSTSMCSLVKRCCADVGGAKDTMTSLKNRCLTGSDDVTGLAMTSLTRSPQEPAHTHTHTEADGVVAEHQLCVISLEKPVQTSSPVWATHDSRQSCALAARRD